MNGARLRTLWHSRSARERIVLSIGAVAVVALAAYGGLWRPLHADLARLQAELPRMRAQATEVKQAADEIAKLRAKAPSGAIERAQLPSLLTRTAASHNLAAPQLGGEANAARIKATFERVGFDPWLAWIDDLHRSHRIVVVAARVSAVDTAGNVRAEVELTLASGAR